MLENINFFRIFYLYVWFYFVFSMTILTIKNPMPQVIEHITRNICLKKSGGNIEKCKRRYNLKFCEFFQKFKFLKITNTM